MVQKLERLLLPRDWITNYKEMAGLHLYSILSSTFVESTAKTNVLSFKNNLYMLSISPKPVLSVLRRRPINDYTIPSLSASNTTVPSTAYTGTPGGAPILSRVNAVTY